jgi:hypothetical protein
VPVALELPDLAALAALLLALIVIFSLKQLASILVSLFRFVPLVGGWISSNLQSHVVDALGAEQSWALGAMGGLVAIAWTPIKWLEVLFKDIGDLGWAGVQWAQHYAGNVIPVLLGQQASFSTQLYHQALSYADSDLHQALDVGESLYTQAIAHADADAGSVAGFATQLYKQALSYTDQEVHIVKGDAQSLYNQAIAHADADAGSVAGFATQLYNQALAWTDQQVGKAKDWAGGEITDIRGEIGSLKDSIPGQVAHAIAPTVAEVGVLAQTVKEVEECTDAICEAQAGPNLANLSNLINGLSTLITDGVLFSFIAAAVADPEGTATEVIDLVGDLVQDTASAVVSLVNAA